jgi:hypothetical protein
MLLWPVCCMITRSGTPARAAEVIVESRGSQPRVPLHNHGTSAVAARQASIIDSPAGSSCLKPVSSETSTKAPSHQEDEVMQVLCRGRPLGFANSLYRSLKAPRDGALLRECRTCTRISKPSQ